MLVSISGSQGSGKAQPLYSKVLTPGGWVKMGELQVGDLVCTPSGELAPVLNIFPFDSKPVYQITCHDGSSTHACIDHLWKCYFFNELKTTGEVIEYEDIVSTNFIIQYLKTSNHDIYIPIISKSTHWNDAINLTEELLSSVGHTFKKYPTMWQTVFEDHKDALKLQQFVWRLGGLATLKYDSRIGTEVNIDLVSNKRKIVDIKYKQDEECRCIVIDHPDRLYITDDYIVTHNTTILDKIKELGYNTISRKTSRSILADWNVTLDQVNNDPELTIKFQDEIIKRKHHDEYEFYQHNKEIWFTERTYADLMTYFLISFGKDNKYSTNINEYYKKCIKFQQTYNKVFYLKAGHFTPVHDGTRGSNVHYSRMTDLTMLDLTTQMTQQQRLAIIDTPCLEQRLNIILAHCGLL